MACHPSVTCLTALSRDIIDIMSGMLLTRYGFGVTRGRYPCRVAIGL